MSNSSTKAPPDRWLSVYDGALLAGYVDEVRDGFRAYDVAGRPIGATYKTQAAAVRSIPPPAALIALTSQRGAP